MMTTTEPSPDGSERMRSRDAEDDDEVNPVADPVHSKLPRRRRSRILALQYLYQADVLFVRGGVPPEPAEDFLRETEPDATIATFALSLVDGVHEHQRAIDETISQTAHNWRLDRMTAVDRTILRIATYELQYCPDIPPKVAINEAIELAKRFSTERSPSFVNGILDRIANLPADATGE